MPKGVYDRSKAASYGSKGKNPGRSPTKEHPAELAFILERIETFYGITLESMKVQITKEPINQARRFLIYYLINELGYSSGECHRFFGRKGNPMSTQKFSEKFRENHEQLEEYKQLIK